MKRIRNLALCAFGLLAFALGSCDDDAFERLNTDPTKATKIDPNLQFSTCEAQVWGYWIYQETALKYMAPFCQYLMGDWGITNYGGQYLKNTQYMGYIYEKMYPLTVKELVDIINKTSSTKHRNLHYMARIFKVYVFGIITDVYGDVPYSEAGKGYIEGIVQPKFDKQEDIYKDFMNELQVAADSLDTKSEEQVSGDIIYNGDVKKWKKLANSLHLRYALRMVNAAPELAKQEAIKATHNEEGIIDTSADEALVKYVSNLFDWTNEEYRRSGIAQLMRGREEYPTMYICSTFFNHLEETEDPRLFVYCRTYDESSPNAPLERHDITDEMRDPSSNAKFQPVEPGFFWYDKWPSGYWSKIAKKWVMKECRPQVNNIFLQLTSPGVIMTYAETQLLLAEAVARWGADVGSESVSALYGKGVRAAFHFLEKFGADKFNDSDIDGYLSANGVPDDLEGQLKAINTQLWILHFNNLWEGYSNWRRSDYPQLKPSPEYGAKCINSQETPLRLCYPIFESSYNKASYDEAIQRLGGSDNWNKPVWWAK